MKQQREQAQERPNYTPVSLHRRSLCHTSNTRLGRRTVCSAPRTAQPARADRFWSRHLHERLRPQRSETEAAARAGPATIANKPAVELVAIIAGTTVLTLSVKHPIYGQSPVNKAEKLNDYGRAKPAPTNILPTVRFARAELRLFRSHRFSPLQ